MNRGCGILPQAFTNPSTSPAIAPNSSFRSEFQEGSRQDAAATIPVLRPPPRQPPKISRLPLRKRIPEKHRPFLLRQDELFISVKRAVQHSGQRLEVEVSPDPPSIDVSLIRGDVGHDGGPDLAEITDLRSSPRSPRSPAGRLHQSSPLFPRVHSHRGLDHPGGRAMKHPHP